MVSCTLGSRYIYTLILYSHLIMPVVPVGSGNGTGKPGEGLLSALASSPGDQATGSRYVFWFESLEIHSPRQYLSFQTYHSTNVPDP